MQFSLALVCSLVQFDPIDRAQSGAPTLGQSEHGSDENERVLRILQSSSITGTSPSDCWGFNSSGVMLLAYFIALVDWQCYLAFLKDKMEIIFFKQLSPTYNT